MDTGEYRSELGEWRTAQRRADPRLRAYVHGYFASSSRLRMPVRERHLPSIEVPLILNFGSPHRGFADAASQQPTSRDGVWIVGLHNRHQLTEAIGERHFMVVRFTPIGAHLFLRMPMHLIANQAIDLESIDPGLARVLLGRVGAAATWADRFQTMDSLIAERVGGMTMPFSIGSAWDRLLATDGRMALGALAAEMNCSHRTLIARFRTSVGFSPKAIGRLMRFNRAVRALDRLSAARVNAPAGKPYIEGRQPGDQPVNAVQWAHLAAVYGYFDQAHLIKEFQAFAGSTPAAFLREVSHLG